MDFGSFAKLLWPQPYFDLATAVQLVGQSRHTLRVQLARWSKAGKLLPLKRGMYAFAEPYAAQPVNPAELANQLYTPSYLSGQWALSYYALVPEGVGMYTSITMRVPRTFRNALGVFRYQSIKPAGFFGYHAVQIDGRAVIIAEPEKALLDFWHLQPGPWAIQRLKEMRFQNTDLVDAGRLREYARRLESPRLLRAADLWPEVCSQDQEGTVTL